MINWIKFQRSNYFFLNFIIWGIALMILSYSLFFNPEKQNYPVHSLCDKYKVPEKKCISKGLSRSFSYIIRFEFDKAKKMNKLAIPLFIFFLAQFTGRSLLFFAKENKKIILADVIISSLMFLWAFYPFIVNLFIINSP